MFCLHIIIIFVELMSDITVVDILALLDRYGLGDLRQKFIG